MQLMAWSWPMRLDLTRLVPNEPKLRRKLNSIDQPVAIWAGVGPARASAHEFYISLEIVCRVSA